MTIPEIFAAAASTKGKQYVADRIICLDANGKFAEADSPAAAHVLLNFGGTMPQKLAAEIGVPNGTEAEATETAEEGE